jgi:hypothetical protein
MCPEEAVNECFYTLLISGFFLPSAESAGENTCNDGIIM